jgi:hypothetical protein
MHAVIPYYGGHNAHPTNEYILCHVRSVDHKKDMLNCEYRNCFVEQLPDFYRLFAYLHNEVLKHSE